MLKSNCAFWYVLELFQVRNVIEYPSVTDKFLNCFEKIGRKWSFHTKNNRGLSLLPYENLTHSLIAIQ